MASGWRAVLEMVSTVEDSSGGTGAMLTAWLPLGFCGGLGAFGHSEPHLRNTVN